MTEGSTGLQHRKFGLFSPNPLSKCAFQIIPAASVGGIFIIRGRVAFRLQTQSLRWMGPDWYDTLLLKLPNPDSTFDQKKWPWLKTNVPKCHGATKYEIIRLSGHIHRFLTIIVSFFFFFNYMNSMRLKVRCWQLWLGTGMDGKCWDALTGRLYTINCFC